jgi:hypothetical protein
LKELSVEAVENRYKHVPDHLVSEGSINYNEVAFISPFEKLHRYLSQLPAFFLLENRLDGLK